MQPPFSVHQFALQGDGGTELGLRLCQGPQCREFAGFGAFAGRSRRIGGWQRHGGAEILPERLPRFRALTVS